MSRAISCWRLFEVGSGTYESKYQGLQVEGGPCTPFKIVNTWKDATTNIIQDMTFPQMLRRGGSGNSVLFTISLRGRGVTGDWGDFPKLTAYFI